MEGETRSQNLRTGVPGLDEVLPQGISPSLTLLIEGTPGSGKTTLALQMLAGGARRGEQGLFITLADSRDELVSFAASHGWSLDGVSVLDSLRDEYLTGGGQTFFRPGEVEIPEISKRIMAEIERVRPVRVVIDSLSELHLFMPDALEFHRQVNALKRFFRRKGVTALLIQPAGQAERDLHLETLAHGIIELQHVPRDYGSDRRRLRVVKLRETEYIPGYHDYSIEKDGIVVYPRTAGPGRRVPAPPDGRAVSSGITEMDTLLGGGLRRGTSMLLLGTTGTGKSSLAAQYAVAAAARGERSHVYLFDETADTFILRCRALGMAVEEAAGKGLVEIEEIGPALTSVGEFACRVRRSVEENGTRIMVVDSVGGYMNALPEDCSLLLQAHELLSYLTRQGVTTLLVQAGLFGDSGTPGDLTYLSDAIVLFRWFESRGAIRTCISVLKTRYGLHDSTIREYSLESGRIRIGAPLREFERVLSGFPSLAGKPGSGGPLDRNGAA